MTRPKNRISIDLPSAKDANTASLVLFSSPVTMLEQGVEYPSDPE